MRWQCALLQRWLPEYPDGDLPALGKRWLKSHVAHCSACRQELAGLREVVAAVEAAPMADPGPEFWGEFSRDLHLKLVQTAPGRPDCPLDARPPAVPVALSSGGAGPGGAAAVCGGAFHRARPPRPEPGPGKCLKRPPRWRPSTRGRRCRRRRWPRCPAWKNSFRSP